MFKQTIRDHWVSLTVVSVLLVLLAFFYQQSVKIKVGNLYYVDAIANDLRTQDTIIERDMGNLVHGRLGHFDSLVQGTKAIDVLMTKLEAAIGDKPALTGDLRTLREAVEFQKEPLEAFKTGLSVFRNSIRYLPTLIEQTEQEFPGQRAALLKVYKEILAMTAKPSEFKLIRLKKVIQGMDHPQLKAVVEHLNVIIRYYSSVEQAMYAYVNCGVSEASEQLLDHYHQWFNEELSIAESYKLLLLIFSVVLLVYITVILWRLQTSSRALQRSHMFLHYLQKALDNHAIVTITDQVGNITFANDKFCEVSGYSQEEVMGENHRILKSGEHSDDFYKELWVTLAKGETWQGVIKNRKKDGGFYWVNTTITPFLNESGNPWQYVSVRTNITNQVIAEERLKASHDRYRNLSEVIPYALGLVQNGKWTYINPTAVSMFGASSSSDMLDKPIADYIGAADVEHITNQITHVNEQQPMLMQEVKLRTYGGKVFDAEIQASAFTWSGDQMVLVAMHDISVRKQEEEERNQYLEQLEHTQRLESLGVLAGGIAHDFNNILTSIMGNTALASQHIRDTDMLPSYLNKVSRASERAAELCQQMLMYSGGGAIEKNPVVLTTLLHDVVSMTATTMRDQIQLNTNVAPNLPAIDADVRQMQQVMLNLLTNAGEAIDEVGTVDVKLGVMDIDASHLLSAVTSQGVKEGEYVFLEVSDTGCGMDEATKARIFEPFFTTKFTGRGLGMSAIMGIVGAHHGAVFLTTELGVGTTIRVAFPALEEEFVIPDSQPAESVRKKFSGTILVADDEEGILELAEDVLKDVGFEVITAVDGQDAMDKFDQYQDVLSGVVCDMVMPKFGGAEVVHYIRKHNADLPILVSSGYDEDAIANIKKGSISGFIHKPYMPEALIAEVERVLNLSH